MVPSVPMSKRHLIGLITNDLVGTYQYSFWTGMKAAAREEDCDVVSFDGGELGSPYPNKFMRASVFEHVAETKPAALVILAPVIANSSGFSQIESFLKAFGKIPVLTVGAEIPGLPRLAVNNASGMDALVEHLVVVHQKKRFVYLGGPLQNPDALQRHDTFLRVLARHNIAFDPSQDLDGEFDFGIGKTKVLEALKAGVDFDAVVAANDDMALGAMDALREAGRRIPDDVVVTGFDDIDESSQTMPALTTVRQPVFEQGMASLRLALDLAEGSPVAPVITQSASLVCRCSCGCQSASTIEAARRLAATDLRTTPVSGLGSAEHIRSVQEQCADLMGGTRYNGTLEDLVKAIAEDCQRHGTAAARGAFVFLVEAASHPDEGDDRWQIFLSRLRVASQRFLPADPPVLFAFEGIIHQFRVLVHERVSQRTSTLAAQQHRWARAMHETACRMLEKFDSEHLCQTLAQDAKGLQISTLQLLVREPDLPENEFRLGLSIVRGTQVHLSPDGQATTFGSAFRAITRNSALRSAVVVEPLFFGGEQLGFLLLEMASRRGALMDSLRGQISASLMGARILHAAAGMPVRRRKEPVLA